MGVVAVLGAGKIGEALLAGLLASGRTTDELVFTERHPERAAELTARLGVAGVDVADAAARAEVLVVAVKPQDIAPVLAELAPVLRPGTLVVTLCAGLPIALFEGALPEGTPVVRVMPNTPMLVGEAMSAMSPGTPRHRGAARDGREDARRRRPRGAGARGAAGRRHRAVGLRARLLLLPRRGHDRRRDPARPAARRGRRADRPVGLRGGARCCANRPTTRCSCARP